ncbi:hypothetical protein BJY52DRAFT_1284300, partial [Lactarius psammicola]
QYVRESECTVRQVFARARASSHCINFFDELDARRAARTCSTQRCAAPGGSTSCSTSTCPWRTSVPKSWLAASAARGTTAPIWLRSCGRWARRDFVGHWACCGRWIGVPLAPRVTPRAWWCWLRTSRPRWIRSCLA